MTISGIAIDPARPEEETLLANLLELYIHDLSEVFGVDIGADGKFGYSKLPLYWSDPNRFPFLIRADGSIAGFALVTRGSPASDDPDALDVAEFFVLRRHRRAGLGRRAAFQLWDGMPGQWVVRVSAGNINALSFWKGAIHEYSQGEFTHSERPGSPHNWHVFSFASRVSIASG